MLKTGSGLKIKLPHDDHEVQVFDMEHKPFLGKIQEENFKKLQETLETHNITFEKVWFGRFTRLKSSYRYGEVKESTNTITNFLFESSDRKVYWRKYEGLKEGSGGNFLYLRKQKIQLMSWFSMTEEERNEIIESMK